MHGKILSFEKPRSKYHLHIAVAPQKMNDRFELFLEKATEIESMKSRLLYAIARAKSDQ
jgi:hypothetical protein